MPAADPPSRCAYRPERWRSVRVPARSPSGWVAPWTPEQVGDLQSRYTRPCARCDPDRPKARSCELVYDGWRCVHCGTRYGVHHGVPYLPAALDVTRAYAYDPDLAVAMWLEGYRPRNARRLTVGDRVIYRPTGPAGEPLAATEAAVVDVQWLHAPATATASDLAWGRYRYGVQAVLRGPHGDVELTVGPFQEVWVYDWDLVAPDT